MGENSANLAALIGSRICHDLISPIGAITNGLELLDMAGNVPGPELDLISDSVGNAGARIRFFRVAFGAAGDQLLGRPEVVAILDDLNRGGRLNMQWGPLDAQPRSLTRLAFLALQCLETATPYGGNAQVFCDRDDWTVTANATKLNIDEQLWSHLSSPQSDVNITPAQVQFALLPVVAAEIGRRIKVGFSETQVSIQF
ncbi:histidine phosphotransferase family protein [Aliisedimentitalea scapharcae]|uniref:Histidine phosphotransferase family protein n=1 Tax=Aliisedimentitalea scapharcae TaxID=1524259 RepID=A0ABZ2XPG0_9RHOB